MEGRKPCFASASRARRASPLSGQPRGLPCSLLQCRSLFLGHVRWSETEPDRTSFREHAMEEASPKVEAREIRVVPIGNIEIEAGQRCDRAGPSFGSVSGLEAILRSRPNMSLLFVYELPMKSTRRKPGRAASDASSGALSPFASAEPSSGATPSEPASTTANPWLPFRSR